MQMIEKFIKQYEFYLQEIDKKCAAVYKNLPNLPCFPKCKGRVACCKQIFPLSFIEAFYVSKGFKKLDRAIRRRLENEAKKSASKIEKEFSAASLRHMYTNTDYETHNKAQQSIAHFLLSMKIDCPFLSNELCLIYPNRNIDCRLHGLAYDKNTNEILGCHRHAEIYKDAPSRMKFALHALPNNFMYKEKIALDAEAITALANNSIYKHVRYLASPFTPILKDFSAFDWREFFTKKIPAQKIIPNTYTLIFD